MKQKAGGSSFVGNFPIIAAWLGALGLFAATLSADGQTRQRVLIDSGWTFQLGDPVDVTTNVTVYPEIPYLPKLGSGFDVSPQEVTGTNSEGYLETVRPDPVATHAGENVSYVMTNYNDSGWRQLNLPHDWAVELPFDSTADEGHGYKSGIIGSTSSNTIAWYRRTFTIPAGEAGQAFWLEFDGVYRNCLVWLNGHILGRNVSGYSSFSFDVTHYANPGGTNVLVVRVDASRFEGWFYEGAGIYRHVWLVNANPVHVAHWGTFVATTNLTGANAGLSVQTDVTNQSALTANGSLTSTIYDANSNIVATATAAATPAAGTDQVVTQSFTLTNANLWSPQSPYLYTLVSTVSNQNALADAYNTTFGVRVVSFDGTNGVFINGQHVEIQGMANHQDHAGVGSALPDRLQYFRIEKLKEMGVTAYRTAHGPPTPELLDACDRLGMLVLDENRRIGTNLEPMSELDRQILRDRNHPSVFCWSMANEEWDMQGSATGGVIMSNMVGLVHSLDSTRKCTAALNSGYGTAPFGSVGFITALDVDGFNYSSGNLTTNFHGTHPDVIGTEQGATGTTRGMYTNDPVNDYVEAYDLITYSALSFGSPAETWWPTFQGYPWASGAFNWTGFDYRGEPTPFSWPEISSQFGVMDTCGFPKDNFYYYQANWSPKPVLHLLPHWNWAGMEGQPINVWAYGNCQAVELFTNGVSLGRQTLNVLSHLSWSIPYSPGTLLAIGYNNGVAVITNTVQTTGAPASIALIPDRSTILDDGRDVSVVAVQVLDSQGLVVPTSTNEINFSISGGVIIGVGNGDPSSLEADKGSQRAVFNGLAEVIVQSVSNQTGSIILGATSTGLTSTNVTVTAAATLPVPAAPTGVTALAGDGQVALSWDVVPGATGYNVKRATVSHGTYTVLATNTAVLGYTDTSGSLLTTYYYVITATNAYGESLNSVEVSCAPNAFVSGLNATVTNSQVQLQWNAHVGATGYAVERAQVSGGPYSIVATNVAATNYTDATVSPCQTYYYVVTMLIGNTDSLPSSEAGIAVLGSLPWPFQNSDIGSVGLAGSASYCGGQYAVQGSGSDIYNTADAFQFVYFYLAKGTNVSITAQIASVEDTSPNAKGAVMIRESLASGSRHILADVTPGVGLEVGYRTSTGGSTTYTSVSGQTAPYWVRLSRSNSTFQVFNSPDGNTWTQNGANVSITMSNGVYVGLAVCAHDNAVLCASEFDNVSVSPMPANSGPELAAIGNETVNVGQTVAFTASATDTNLPTPTLTFSLASGPSNATVNPNSGAFSWRPLVSQANSINPITLMVSDNAVPSSNAVRNFTVTVNPLVLPAVSSAAVNNGHFSLRLTGQTGPDYAVQVSSNLVNWSTLFITNSPAMPFDWMDTNSLQSLQFYRFQVGPPLP